MPADARMPIEAALTSFSRDVVSDGSVVLQAKEGPSGEWGWPVRIGVLPNPAGLAVANKLAAQPFAKCGWGHIVVLGVDSQDCDIAAIARGLT